MAGNVERTGIIGVEIFRIYCVSIFARSRAERSTVEMPFVGGEKRILLSGRRIYHTRSATWSGAATETAGINGNRPDCIERYCPSRLHKGSCRHAAGLSADAAHRRYVKIQLETVARHTDTAKRDRSQEKQARDEELQINYIIGHISSDLKIP